MKYILNKYIFFILVFIAVFLFDFIIFQIFLSPLIFGNQVSVTAGMTLLATCFLIVPAFVAYYIVIKRQQNPMTELQKAVTMRRTKIIFGFILAIILILVFKDLTVGKINPYNFQPITDQEFKKPLKIVISKKIGEDEYYLKEAEQGGVSLFQKVGANSMDDTFIFDLPALIDSKSVTDFWYDNTARTTIVVTEKSVNIRNRYEQIFKYSLNPKEGEPLLVLKTSSLGIYSGNDKILDYFSDIDTSLLQSGGGDGCGGFGTIWVLKGMSSQVIQEFGAGCFSVDKPRFAGYDGKLLYFALFNYGESKKPGDFGVLGLKEIYKINPRTKGKITIASSNFPEDVTEVYLSGDNKHLILRAAQNYLLNLEQPFEIKEASVSANVQE